MAAHGVQRQGTFCCRTVCTTSSESVVLLERALGVDWHTVSHAPLPPQFTTSMKGAHIRYNSNMLHGGCPAATVPPPFKKKQKFQNICVISLNFGTTCHAKRVASTKTICSDRSYWALLHFTASLEDYRRQARKMSRNGGTVCAGLRRQRPCKLRIGQQRGGGGHRSGVLVGTCDAQQLVVFQGSMPLGLFAILGEWRGGLTCARPPVPKSSDFPVHLRSLPLWLAGAFCSDPPPLANRTPPPPPTPTPATHPTHHTQCFNGSNTGTDAYCGEVAYPA